VPPAILARSGHYSCHEHHSLFLPSEYQVVNELLILGLFETLCIRGIDHVMYSCPPLQ
jgi:hypothetical protein